MITQSRLKELLHYDPTTGVFRWRHVRRNKSLPWDVAGSVQHQGYIRITVDDERHMAHRLAWVYMTGEAPPDQVDHKDLDKSNNSWGNLRAADNTLNHWNESTRSTNKSGHKGIWWHKQSRKWEAAVRLNGKQHTVGRYERIEDAVEAVKQYREQHHGDYARH
jgi:hypothetical protein